jgi:hypothetical protein
MNYLLNKKLLLRFYIFIILTLFPLSLAQANDFAAWTDSTSNPLLGGSTDGVNRAYYPCVIKVGSDYHIWYGDGSNTRHSISTNFDFSDVTFPAPAVTGLIATGPYHPRVLYNASGWDIGVTHYAGPFLMYYTDGANWGVNPRVAHSADGNSWTDIEACAGVIAYSSSPVIYNFDVIYEGGTTWKAYADNGSGLIEYYVSTDGINWTGTAHNILSSLQPWETWFTSPHVIKSGGQYIMYYGSGGAGSNEAVGVAFSNNGQNFTKSSSNPIFSITDGASWRNNRTYTPFIIPDGTSWTMYYTGRSSTGVYSIGYALPTSLPPTGFITINSGDASTNSTTVTLTLPCSDSTGCLQMCISNTSSCSSWESFFSTKTWTLTAGDGTKTVYAWFKNSIGNENTLPYSDSILLDTPPTTTALPPGSIYNTGQSVTLTCSDGGGSGCENIYYTTDGSDPTPGSPVYSNPINIVTTTTLKFFAVDVAGNQESIKSEAYTIQSIDPLTITTSSLPSGMIDISYGVTLTATGGIPPYNWSLSAGTLPNGLNLNSSTGEISGTPTTTGTFNFTPEVTDANLDNAIRNLSIDIQSAPVKVGSDYYYNPQDAYDNCLNGNTIQIQALEFLGDFFCDKSISIMLTGGYDADYISTPSYTTINGKLTITDGTVVIENIIIK